MSLGFRLRDLRVMLPHDLCADPGLGLDREWLVTNGIGGFASGSVAGALTRRYHGMLVAALRPPLGRTLVVSKLDEIAIIGRDHFPLYTNVWKEGVIEPAGCVHLRAFGVHLGVPTWEYEFCGCRLTKRVWMSSGRNTTFVGYAFEGCEPMTLSSRVLVNARDYHSLTYGDRPAWRTGSDGSGLRACCGETGLTARVTCAVGGAEVCWSADHTWYDDFYLPVEDERGQDCLENHVCAGHGRVDLSPGEEVVFVISAEEDGPAESESRVGAAQGRALQLLSQWAGGAAEVADPPEVGQLVVAADQFVVGRQHKDGGAGYTTIAGYPWFSDWGRDTMIALPGLTLVTGRHDVARHMLLTWAEYVDRGMIPNRFPDYGDAPEYHTADATLWYLWAIDQYFRVTGDRETLRALFPVMREVVAWHQRGTRHNLRVAKDGLIAGGEEGVNLTWMDAKVDGRVITPRMGKAIELSALWYDGLCNLAALSGMLGENGEAYAREAERARESFSKFWNKDRGYCFDILDGPAGDDPALRPNQIFAVSLRHSPLDRVQQEAVIEACERDLLTWYGLRSLGTREAAYEGVYRGTLVERDEAYHQGTVWGWLLGPFVLAHYRVYADAAASRRMLEPMLSQVYSHAVGTLSEIFDGDPPCRPRGCVAQAWSVAETLRAWHVTQKGWAV